MGPAHEREPSELYALECDEGWAGASSAKKCFLTYVAWHCSGSAVDRALVPT